MRSDNVATAITGGSRPEQVADNAVAAGRTLSAETLAGIDAALGDAVISDPALTAQSAPATRLA